MWEDVSNTSSSGANNGPNLYLDNGTVMNILRANNAAGNIYVGDLSRIAVWSFASGASLPAIEDTGVKANFASGVALVDPATSQGLYGTPYVDLNGDAADWSAGTHDGSMTLTRNGAVFTDV